MPRSKAAKSKSQKEEVEEKVVEQPEKTKPIIKAKKYKQKTYDQLVRINKSKYERIFLLEANRYEEEDRWAFMVQGTKGSQYHVSLSTQVKCTCMDFRFKQSPCKHIYFIVTQVGQNEELVNYFKSDKKISKNAYKILDQQLFQRLKSRIESQKKDQGDIDLKDDKDCVICFSQMEKETQALEDCGTCKKYFHTECLATWKSRNPSCPLCRGPLSGGDRDALSKVVGINI